VLPTDWKCFYEARLSLIKKALSKLSGGGMKEAEKSWWDLANIWFGKKKEYGCYFLYVLKCAIFFLGKKTMKTYINNTVLHAFLRAAQFHELESLSLPKFL
jgi:hypothetical protein